jgi:hypothetical protein
VTEKELADRLVVARRVQDKFPDELPRPSISRAIARSGCLRVADSRRKSTYLTLIDHASDSPLIATIAGPLPNTTLPPSLPISLTRRSTESP